MRGVFVLLAGCWSAAPSPPTPPAPSTAPRTRPAAVEWTPVRKRLPAHSEWSGRYTCSQGVTGVALVIDLTPDGEATAIFDFGPVPENPRVPTGSYELHGHAELEADQRFEPKRWIVQPPGYTMVALTVTSDRAHRELSGTIETASCGAIEVKRN